MNEDVQIVKATITDTGLEERDVAALVADLIPLIDSEQDAKWAIGDVLVKRIHTGVRTPVVQEGGTGNGASEWFATTARLLAEQGREVSEATLRDRYRTSLAFPAKERVARVGWYTHLTIAKGGPSESAPERMTKFLRWCEAKGSQPTKREAQEFLGQPVSGQVGEPGAKAYIEAHPEVVAEVITANPEVAKAVAANPAVVKAIMEHPAATLRGEDDVPRGPQPPENILAELVGTDARPNPSAGLIWEISNKVRDLRMAIPYVGDPDDSDRLVEKIRELIAGLEDCIAAAEIGRAAHIWGRLASLEEQHPELATGDDK